MSETTKKVTKKSEEKEKSLDVGKMGFGVIALMAMFPMAYPNAQLPSLAQIASVVEYTGYALFTGGGVFLGLDTINKIKNRKGGK